jgi:2-polyprenyl-3-methyl-5-hydroxy-6-metoxy-1,4-benzoquinol methylase
MPSFRQRSTAKELLDAPGIPFDAIRKNMQELDTINRLLGGHAVTIAGVHSLVGDRHEGRPLSIVEIGCGGGDNLRAIGNWAKRKGIGVSLAGIDLNPECIRFAGNAPGNEGIGFTCSDYREAIFESKPDILFSSLFCHHFTNEELVAQLNWLQANCALWFFINDLHRHPIAYHSIRLLTRIFSNSYLVKNDAPLSVRRGFSRADWNHLIAQAGLPAAKIRWMWAFRWLIISRA